MNLDYAGKTLVLIVATFFLFRLGYLLATRYFNETFFPWLGIIIFTFRTYAKQIFD